MGINWGDDSDKKDKLGRNWGDAEVDSQQKQPDSAKIDDLLRRAQPMIEQVNALYNQFIAGVERLPPTEKRKQLEAVMTQLRDTPKPNQTYAFRVSTLSNHFLSFCERWDRLIRDLESGKIKRTAGPKR